MGEERPEENHPQSWPGEKERVLLRALRWTLFPPTRVARPVRLPADPLQPGEVAVTYVGHATLLVQTRNFCFLTDPVFSNRVFFIRRLVPPALRIAELPRLDLVLVSHGHLDHCDVPSLKRLPKGAPMISSPGLLDLLPRANPKQQLAWWESAEIGRARVTSVPSKHWGRRWLGEDGRGYGGFVVEVDGAAIYFGGDTAYFPGFADIGKRFAIDVALLPIGAYRPESFQRNHISPVDAVRAFQEMGARRMIPYHWGTFVLSREPIDEPPKLLCETAEREKVSDRVLLLHHGETGRIAARAAQERGREARHAG